MKLKPTLLKDVPAIMEIVSDAQEYLAEQEIDQWQDGYPTEEQINLDIENNESYIVLSNSEEVIATTVFTTRLEPTYNFIEGNWLTDSNTIYGVIHRLAVRKSARKLGVANFIVDECEAMLNKFEAPSLRIDTHRDNTGMQHLIKKLGYQYCGLIYLENGDERFAFEKLNQPK